MLLSLTKPIFKVTRLIIFVFFLFLAFPINKVHALTCSDDLTSKVMISEFSSATTTEWVELLGADQDNSLNLSGCSLVLTAGDETTVTKTLSGTLPRSGFLTFGLDANSLDNSGGKLEFKDAGGTAIYTVTYGTYTSAPQHVSSAPNSSQAAWLNPSTQPTAWSVGTATKGWCNPEGFNGCPTVANITSEMSSEGVTTNLGEVTDFSRASGLYFEKTGEGRIAFNKEINFTDRDALSWMGTLDTSLSISNGSITLDADLIQNFIDTQATLTMYGLNYNNPTVLVNGATDTQGVVSGLSYNKAAGTLTFTAAHFTTFTATETVVSSSVSNPGPPSCGDWSPSSSPKLFQIDTTKNTAKLFFVPAGNPISYYYVAYGHKEGDETFGTSFNQGPSNGVLSYTIRDLQPNTEYYFKIRGGNGCAPGAWSKYLKAKTEGTKIVQADVIDKPVPSPSLSKPTPSEKVTINENNEEQLNIKEPSKDIIETPENKVKEPVLNETEAENKSMFSRILQFFLNLFK